MTPRNNWENAFDLLLFIGALLFIIGLGMLMGTCDIKPAHAAPYVSGGPAVRVADGGTSAHNAADARRNLGISMSTIPGLRDTLSSLFYNAIQDPLLRVKDSQFWIKNAADTTKKAQFSAALILTGTTRTYTFPDTNGTLATLNKTQTFTVAQTIAPTADNAGLQLTIPAGGINNVFVVYSTDNASKVSWIDPGGINIAPAFAINPLGASFQLSISNKTPLAASRTYSLDNTILSTDFMMTGGTQTVPGLKTFNGSPVFSGGAVANIDGTTAHWHYRDQTDNTKQFAWLASGVTTGTTRTFTVPNVTATLDVVGNAAAPPGSGSLGKVDLTAQTANITTTNLSSTPPTGLYIVEATLMCTTAAGGAGTLALTVSWTDNIGATSGTPITSFPLTATGRADGRQFLRVNSGDITYAVTITGSYSTAQYAVYVRVISLG